MKISSVCGLLLFTLFSSIEAYAKENCPDLTGRYTVNPVNRVLIDVGQILKFDLKNNSLGELEIKGNACEELSFFWKEEKLLATNSSQFKFNKDYKCDNGWLIFTSKAPSFRNDMPGIYKGETTIKLSIDNIYYGLKVESTFKGRENITLFAYDSARISFLKWWGKKELVENMVLSAASNNSLKEIETSTESKNILKVKGMLSEKIMSNLLLIGLDDKNNNVLIALKAFKLMDIEQFKENLSKASIYYEIKTNPVWTNNSYFLELLIKPN